MITLKTPVGTLTRDRLESIFFLRWSIFSKVIQCCTDPSFKFYTQIVFVCIYFISFIFKCLKSNPAAISILKMSTGIIFLNFSIKILTGLFPSFETQFTSMPVSIRILKICGQKSTQKNTARIA